MSLTWLVTIVEANKKWWQSNSFNLKILAGLQFTNILDFAIMMPLGPHFMRDFQIDTQQFGFLVASYTVSASVVGFLSSLWVDLYPRRHTLLFVYAGFTIATLLCGFSDSYYLLMASRLLAGAFAGILGATILTIVSDLFVYKERGKAVSAITRAFSVASVIGIPLGLLLADNYGWKFTFIFIAFIAALLWIATFFTMPLLDAHLHQKEKKDFSLQNLFHIARKVQHLKAFSLMAAVVLGGFVVIPYISPYLVGNNSLLEEDLKYVFLVGGIFTYITQKSMGVLSDKYGAKKIFAIMAFLTFIPLYLLTHMTSATLTQAIVITTLFMVFMSGRFVPAMTLIASSALASDRGSFMSMSTAVQQMCAGIASSIGGVILITNIDGSIVYFNWVGYLSIFMGLISILLALWITPYTDEPTPMDVLKTFDEELR